MKKTAPTALEAMEMRKKALEAEILRLCNDFEHQTGLVVVDVKHPRRRANLLQCALKEDDRVDVGTVSPFPFFRDYQ